jgi:hypothetical protein
MVQRYRTVLLRFFIAGQALFWVAISILQLDEITLYASGLALLEQNLHTLDSQNTFETESLETVMLATREPLEWHFKPLDHSVGLSFRQSCVSGIKIVCGANSSDPDLTPTPDPALDLDLSERKKCFYGVYRYRLVPAGMLVRTVSTGTLPTVW